MIDLSRLIPAYALLGFATLCGLALAFAVLLPRSVEQHADEVLLQNVRRWARRLAASGLASGLAVFVLAGASGIANGVLQLPVPSVNDEYAYLLGADTFARGRLANPQHPLWHHFETISVSHDPVYVSKYPPATSAFMALGQRLFGHPWYGQVLAYALACAAFAWMARAWVGPRWALIGGVLVALHPVMQHFARYDYNWSNYSWSHSYWGGAVTMLGASLVFGGTRRFVRDRRTRDASALALGIVLLAFSRPFEGAIAMVPVAWVLAAGFVRGPRDRVRSILRLVAPLLLVGIPALVFLLRYNEATTGDPLRLAHQHYSDQYGAAAELLVSSPKEPPSAYPNREMERFYREWVRPAFLAQKSSWATWWSFKREALERFVWFYLSFGAPALIGTFAIVRRRWWRFAAAISGIAVGLALMTFEFHPHYAATAAPMIHVLLLGGLAWLWRHAGRHALLAHGLVILVVFSGVVARLFMLPVRPEPIEPEDFPKARAEIEAHLRSMPGDDLIVVVYRPDHSVFREWVKNGADLDGAPVVWARDLGDEASRERLLAYYADRNVWILRPDERPRSFARLKRERDRTPASAPATPPPATRGSGLGANESRRPAESKRPPQASLVGEGDRRAS
ncbi:MAG: hypothetical protein R3F35_20965 [Myxococcota bacterium]